ncbi:unnamed protein product, partial [Meganyctiphanes norvegica]
SGGSRAHSVPDCWSSVKTESDPPGSVPAIGGLGFTSNLTLLGAIKTAPKVRPPWRDINEAWTWIPRDRLGWPPHLAVEFFLLLYPTAQHSVYTFLLISSIPG